jgi:transcriptional regulator with XRE-family HTH domain
MLRLKEIRKEKGVTQFDLSKVMDVPPQRISEAECGKRDLRFQEVVRAAEFLGVSLDWLAGLNEKLELALSGEGNKKKPAR